jgi:hypothetical protein
MQLIVVNFISLVEYQYLIARARVCIQVILMAEIGAYELSVLLQIPQYVLVTIGEVLTSVTALSFAYSQVVTVTNVVEVVDITELSYEECSGFANFSICDCCYVYRRP